MVVITGNRDGSAAVDYTVNAALGFPFVTGPEGTDGPVNHVLPAWDAMTGFLAATAILAAERHRRQTGEGQLVELSLSDVGLGVAGHLGLIGEAGLEAQPPGRFRTHADAPLRPAPPTPHPPPLLLPPPTPRLAPLLRP